MDVASVKEALNLNNKFKAITPHTLGMVLDKVGASSGGGSSEMTCPYRVGDVLFSTIDADPKDTYPDTTWVRIAEGRYILCEGSSTDDNGESRTIVNGQTGGVWNHNHTIEHTHTLNKHTHTMEHTHTITSHTHTLNSSGWAKIYFGGSSFIAKDKATGNWTGNAKKTVSGTASTGTVTGTYGIELGGATGASSSTPASGAASNSTTSANSDNTSAASVTNSGDTQVVPPYFCLYAWKRVS